MKKLLVVNLQNPGETHYHNPKTIDSFMWGRRLSNYLMFTVGSEGVVTPITLTSGDVHDIRNQVMEKLK
jgi:hypothetical protein